MEGGAAEATQSSSTPLSSTEWPLPVPIRTDRWTARAMMLTLAVLSMIVSFGTIRKIARLEPPRIPVYAPLLMEQGRHLWLLSDSTSGECLGVMAGGWKELANSELIKFTAITAGPTTTSMRGTVSEYKLLEKLRVTVRGPETTRRISFDGTSWTGAPSPTEEPIMMLDGQGGTRYLKLPNRVARGLNGALLTAHIKFEEALPAEFFACKRRLSSSTRDFLKEWL